MDDIVNSLSLGLLQENNEDLDDSHELDVELAESEATDYEGHVDACASEPSQSPSSSNRKITHEEAMQIIETDRDANTLLLADAGDCIPHFNSLLRHPHLTLVGVAIAAIAGPNAQQTIRGAIDENYAKYRSHCLAANTTANPEVEVLSIDNVVSFLAAHRNVHFVVVATSLPARTEHCRWALSARRNVLALSPLADDQAERRRLRRLARVNGQFLVHFAHPHADEGGGISRLTLSTQTDRDRRRAAEQKDYTLGVVGGIVCLCFPLLVANRRPSPNSFRKGVAIGAMLSLLILSIAISIIVLGV